MSSPDEKIHEGVFAVHKPSSLTSAQVLRDLQTAFKTSTLFAPWLAREQARKDNESHNQRQKRRSWKQRQPLQVKLGHGGTLDPLATGVLIVGVGSGTKELSKFLECTKSYETVVLFGAETDTYDIVGKVVKRAPFEHVTREKIEEVLSRLRGKIMQRPPVYSALRVNGKRLYEYAREGKEVPVEIEERPVEVESLEVVEWMDGGSHDHRWPEQAVQEPDGNDSKRVKTSAGSDEMVTRPEAAGDGGDVHVKATKDAPAEPDRALAPDPDPSTGDPTEPISQSNTISSTAPPCPAPAVRLKMTVTSGFYVRSLAHDLGNAVGSAGLMASLVRTRQGDFELGKNVLEYADLEKGEEVWGDKIESMLRSWSEKEG